MLPEDATADDRAHLERALGLDRPVYQQLTIFLKGAVRGDLGQSIRYRKPAVEVFFERLPNTLTLVPLALLAAIVVSIPLGLLAAVYRGTLIDRVCATIAVLGIATPSFWLGIVLIYVFSIQLGWLPSARMGGPAHYVLPVITLSAFLVAGMMRLVRSSVLEVLDTEFVKLARIKGLSQTVVPISAASRGRRSSSSSSWSSWLRSRRSSRRIRRRNSRSLTSCDRRRGRRAAARGICSGPICSAATC